MILTALTETGLPFELQDGGRHFKIRLAGRFIGILPRNGSSEAYGNTCASKNLVAQVRRAAREIKGVA